MKVADKILSRLQTNLYMKVTDKILSRLETTTIQIPFKTNGKPFLKEIDCKGITQLAQTIFKTRELKISYMLMIYCTVVTK